MSVLLIYKNKIYNPSRAEEHFALCTKTLNVNQPVMKMTIQRIERKDKNFTMISNSLLHDPYLSLDAKGFFALILSLPPNWDFTIAGIAAYTRKSKPWVNKVLKELADHGLCQRKQIKTAEGKFSAGEYIFVERHSNDRRVPLKDSGTRLVRTTAETETNNRESQNRVPANRTTVLERNTRTKENNNDIIAHNSLLSPSSTSKKEVLLFEEKNPESVDRHEYNQEDLIEPPWNQILPIETCATAFIGCRELRDVRQQLITNSGLKGMEHLNRCIEAFNSNLATGGITQKPYEDWKDHFINWLRLQSPNEHIGEAKEAFNRREEKIAEKEAGLKTYKPYVPYTPRSR